MPIRVERRQDPEANESYVGSAGPLPSYLALHELRRIDSNGPTLIPVKPL